MQLDVTQLSLRPHSDKMYVYTYSRPLYYVMEFPLQVWSYQVDIKVFMHTTIAPTQKKFFER